MEGIPCTIHLVFATRSLPKNLIWLLERSAQHKTGNPWKSRSNIVIELCDAINSSNDGKKV